MQCGFKSKRALSAITGLLLIWNAEGKANVPARDKAIVPPATALSPDSGAASLEGANSSVVNGNAAANGPRIPGAEDKLKALFPKVTAVKEMTFLPAEKGGSSLMGLVHRLLGEQVSRDFEGMRIRRFIYQALDGDKPVGLAHGSITEVNNTPIEVQVYYSAEGVIRDLRLEKMPTTILSELESGGYLKQFIGRSTDDFEVTLGRKGKIKSHGVFAAQAKRPSGGTLRAYFDKIARAVRFNAAFMEVAYFITQHPEDVVEAPPQMLEGKQTLLQSPFDKR